MRGRNYGCSEPRGLGTFAVEKVGSSAAEVALVLVPVGAILSVVMMLGSLFFIHDAMMDAAREAARRMSADETVTFQEGITVPCDGALVAGSVSEIACNALAGWPASFQVTASSLPIPGTERSEMRVTITTDLGPGALVNLLGAADGKTMTADVILRSDMPAS